MNNKTATRTTPTVAYQPALRPALPCIYGPVEFREWRDQFVQIDRMLDEGGIETTFVQLALAENAAAWAAVGAKQLRRFAQQSALALRCNVARVLTGLSFRDFAVRTAESSLLQWFLRIGEVDGVKVPAKSTLERFSKWVSEETMTQVHLKLVTQAVAPAPAGAPQPLNLTEPVDATAVFLDSTCLKATLHFPVDWVLLRDAARWAETGLSEKQAQAIIARIDHILTQLPAAIEQAHERIIGERPVPNAEKILSLYEPDVEVLKRGKAGADIEFGNKLWLGETREGLIVDWALLDKAPADSALVLPAVQRLGAQMKLEVEQVWGDRGLFSQANEKSLAKRRIKSGLCPRDPAELQRRLSEEDGFRAGLKRRGGTEARIAIFKHVFAGNPCRAKGFPARTLAVSWAVLAHNLWVLARLKLRQEKAARLEAA